MKTTRQRSFQSITAIHIGVLIGIIIAIFLFYLETLRVGQPWGDDFAMYIHHAQNLVHHRPYGDTGYIFNPEVPLLGPPVYPPVLPLILSSIYWIRGMDIKAMQLLLVC